MKRLLFNLFIAALVLAGISFFAAPGVAFFALRSNAQSNDVQGLQSVVDYDAVRASLRPQLDGRPEATVPPPSILADPIGAVRARLEQGARPAPDVEAYLTPPALYALTLGEGRWASQWSRPSASGVQREGGEPFPSPKYRGMNRARLAVTDAGGSQTLFTFERKGLFEWKLVHIGLPDGATPPTPDAPAKTPQAK